MALQVAAGTPLGDALNQAIQTKLMEVGFAQAADAPALAEYIILMLGNGKNQIEIASELCTDLLGLPADHPDALQFVAWMFQHAQSLNVELNPGQPATQGNGDAMEGAAPQGSAEGAELDTDMSVSNDVSELNAPTGPRSMRNGSNRGGGRDKRIFGQMSRAMDRTGDAVLHRTRGNDRINSHSRNAPSGPRGRGGRGGMNANRITGARLTNAMGGMNGPPGMGGMNANWGMSGQPGEMDLMAMMQQQSQMMAQLQEQLLTGGGGGGGFGQRGGHGKSLFERTQNPRNNRNRHQNRDRSDGAANEGRAADGEDVDMGSSAKREPPNPEETVCKYNLRCTNKECKFAHQSPAAPPNATIDVNDVCTFGAACKNRKCVGRHPSPATKLAHQGEQDCKFFPNCHNPQCPFRHPDMPLCRNGAGCTTEGCKFTHVKVKCRFNPCKNPHCPYTHEEGQQGVFKDKVWTAEGGDHVSERKFVEDGVEDEIIIKGQEENMMDQEGQGHQELVT